MKYEVASSAGQNKRKVVILRREDSHLPERPVKCIESIIMIVITMALMMMPV